MAKRVSIIIYSTYGHIHKLAGGVKKGLESGGVQTKLYQVAETLPKEVVANMKAQKLDLPVLTPFDKEFLEADGYIFGFPTRFGVMPAQMKAFWDATGGHWVKQTLVGKPYGIITSTNSQHGGQETTAFASLPVMSHHGMVFVPIGFTHPNINESHEACGGSPYGATTFAGADGTRMPSAKEMETAEHHGAHFAKFMNRLK